MIEISAVGQPTADQANYNSEEATQTKVRQPARRSSLQSHPLVATTRRFQRSVRESEHLLTAATTACDSCSTHDDSIACPTYGLSATAGSCELPAREPASQVPGTINLDAKLRMASLRRTNYGAVTYPQQYSLQRMALHRSILSLSSGPTRMEKGPWNGKTVGGSSISKIVNEP